MTITIKAVPLGPGSWAIHCSHCGPVEILDATNQQLTDWARGHLEYEHGAAGVTAWS